MLESQSRSKFLVLDVIGGRGEFDNVIDDGGNRPVSIRGMIGRIWYRADETTIELSAIDVCTEPHMHIGWFAFGMGVGLICAFTAFSLSGIIQ